MLELLTNDDPEAAASHLRELDELNSGRPSSSTSAPIPIPDARENGGRVEMDHTVLSHSPEG